MKGSDPKLVYKYFGVLFTDIVFFLVAFIISAVYDNVSYSWLFSKGDVFIICTIPGYLVLRGIVSCIVLKKILLQNISLFAEIFLALVIFNLPAVLGALVISLILTVLSLVPSSITGLIMWMIKEIKEEKQH